MKWLELDPRFEGEDRPHPFSLGIPTVVEALWTSMVERLDKLHPSWMAEVRLGSGIAGLKIDISHPGDGDYVLAWLIIPPDNRLADGVQRIELDELINTKLPGIPNGKGNVRTPIELYQAMLLAGSGANWERFELLGRITLR